MHSASLRRAAAVGLAAALLQLVMIVAFAWPAVRSAPHDVPLVVTGPGAPAVAQRLAAERPGAFEVGTVADPAAARAAVTGGDAYGAIITAPAGPPRLLVASGASPAVAQQLAQAAQTLGGAPAPPVEDVAPGGDGDPRGAGFGALVLPLVLSGIAASVLLTFAVRPIGARVLGAVVFAAVGGLAVTWTAQAWLGVLGGPYLAVAGTAALAVLAVTGTVTGLAALLGRPGLGLGALTLLLLGNPLSAAASAPELLPVPWGALGQFLPPGAAVSGLRSVAFLDGAGAGGPLLVLAAWAAFGLALALGGVLRARRPAEAPAPDPEPALV
ncbi:hypothetical protein [Actinomadura flavalba]|uniref:hypothetical protein n=1 Tax=Actinomadura flavalba TaxID=1120938 RepID=UPI00037C0FDD|nr:hypothetical protein [Actinomadura flavalba]